MALHYYKAKENESNSSYLKRVKSIDDKMKRLTKDIDELTAQAEQLESLSERYEVAKKIKKHKKQLDEIKAELKKDLENYYKWKNSVTVENWREKYKINSKECKR